MIINLVTLKMILLPTLVLASKVLMIMIPILKKQKTITLK